MALGYGWPALRFGSDAAQVGEWVSAGREGRESDSRGGSRGRRANSCLTGADDMNAALMQIGSRMARRRRGSDGAGSREVAATVADTCRGWITRERCGYWKRRGVWCACCALGNSVLITTLARQASTKTKEG